MGVATAHYWLFHYFLALHNSEHIVLGDRRLIALIVCLNTQALATVLRTKYHRRRIHCKLGWINHETHGLSDIGVTNYYMQLHRLLGLHKIITRLEMNEHDIKKVFQIAKYNQLDFRFSNQTFSAIAVVAVQLTRNLISYGVQIKTLVM
jgi:hypothetical protein